jgi:murein DD-endopeptidase MepM/ murein hydrolase activator NlpD
MNQRFVRAACYGIVALLVTAALRASPPEFSEDTGAESVIATPAMPVTLVERVDTLGRGQSLGVLFANAGVAGIQVLEALREAANLDLRRVPAGIPVTFRGSVRDSVPSEVVVQLGIDRLVRLSRQGGAWTGSEERLPWTTDTAMVSGSVDVTLYGAIDQVAADLLPARQRAELAWSLADVFEYRMDMSRDLRTGDSFRVLFERATAPNGAMRLGKVLAASVTLSGKEHNAYRYESETASGKWFDEEGKSLRAAFLRTPVEFRRVSSNFGRRFHPVLKTWRQHAGTDYAAAQGTPVRTIGDGVVISAGRNGGYGNSIDVRHANGYVTRYAHLRNFASGIRKGTRVSIGQTIGYVGMTGLATGPHLHFEVIVGGVQRDPRTALQEKAGAPIPASDRAAFEAQRLALVAALEAADTGSVRLAVKE